MATVPARVSNRLTAVLKRYQPIIESAKLRDVNESDTVIIVTDLLSEMFGFDKYADVTSELAIRGSYCDLATKIDEKVCCLYEIKSAGLDLKDVHTKQAVDYAANKGVDWVVLTNASVWKIYRVIFGRPVDYEIVAEFDLLTLDPKDSNDLGVLYLLCKEAFHKSVLEEYSEQRQALSRFTIAAVVLSPAVLQTIRRELRRLAPGVKIETEEIAAVFTREVLKRDSLEGDKAEEARRKVARAMAKAAREKAAESEPAPLDIHTNSAGQNTQAAAAAVGVGSPEPNAG